MKMKCLFKSVLRGDIVKAGQVLDLTADECKMDVVKNFFVKVEGTEAAKPASVPVPAAPKGETGMFAGLTREQAIMKLTQAGAKVKGNISNRDLVAIYNTTFANIAESVSE